MPDLSAVPDPHLQEIDDPVYLLRLAQYYRQLVSDLKRELRQHGGIDETARKIDLIHRAAGTAQQRADHIIATRAWWRPIVDRDLPHYLRKGILTAILFSFCRR